MYTPKHFTTKELACKHCGELKMSDEFLQELDGLREEYGSALFVNSAYRCSQHPDEIVKADGPGAHNAGLAVDFRVQGEAAVKLLGVALKRGWTGIGVNQKGAGRFLHLDRMPNQLDAPRPGIWSY